MTTLILAWPHKDLQSLSLTNNVKLVQSGKRQSESQEGQVQSPLEVPFTLKLFCSSLCKQYKNANVANFVYYGKNSNECKNSFFLAELLLWYLTGNILGIEVSCGRRADDLRMTCRWPADDTRVRFQVRFHWRMTYFIRNVIRTLVWVAQFHAVLHLVSSACHPQSKELG